MSFLAPSGLYLFSTENFPFTVQWSLTHENVRLEAGTGIFPRRDA